MMPFLVPLDALIATDKLDKEDWVVIWTPACLRARPT